MPHPACGSLFLHSEKRFLNIGLGDIHAAEATLDEIFAYLEQADKPCIVAIDEFQQIGNYAERM